MGKGKTAKLLSAAVSLIVHHLVSRRMPKRSPSVSACGFSGGRRGSMSTRSHSWTEFPLSLQPKAKYLVEGMSVEEAFSYQSQLKLLEHLHNTHKISTDTFDGEIAAIVSAISDASGVGVSREAVSAAVLERSISIAQRLRGLFSFVTFIWVFAIVCAFVAVFFIGSICLKPIIMAITSIPHSFYEFLAYLFDFFLLLVATSTAATLASLWR